MPDRPSKRWTCKDDSVYDRACTWTVYDPDGTARGAAAEREDAERMCRRGARGESLIPVPRPAHRPRLDPTAARVRYSYRLHPDSAAAIASEARRTGESQGQVVDRLACALTNG